MSLCMYLKIFLFHFKLHIVLGDFEATDTCVELVEQGYQLSYSKIHNQHKPSQYGNLNSNSQLIVMEKITLITDSLYKS